MPHTNSASASPGNTRGSYRGSGSLATLTRLQPAIGGPVPVRPARSAIWARAFRKRFFRASLFSDPAWDILLELFAAEQEGRRVTVSSVGFDANIPQTTALRWIKALESEGLIKRADDPLDARRIFLSLSDSALRAMTHYFQGCSAVVAIS